MPSPPLDLRARLSRVPQVGRVTFVGLRPARGEPMTVVERVEVREERGLVGDRSAQRRGHKRQVTLVQGEHLATVARFLGRDAPIDPGLLRRNLVIEGVNLVALTRMRFAIGEEVVLEGTGPCEPCSKMDEALGEGGFHALRGLGGITARVLAGGEIALGDPVRALAYVGIKEE